MNRESRVCCSSSTLWLMVHLFCLKDKVSINHRDNHTGRMELLGPFAYGNENFVISHKPYSDRRDSREAKNSL